MSHKEMVEKICELKKDLLEFLNETVDERGLHCMDTEETGEVVDMIKDLADAEEKCWKAEYYKKIVEAMDDAEKEEELMMKLGTHYDDKMGYTPRRSASTGRYMPSSTHSSRQGYSPMDLDNDNVDWDGSYGRNRMDPYGSHFNEWRDAKRSYTSTKSAEDKRRMDEHANEHVMASISSLREVFREADPEMRRQVKQDLSSLVNEMKV